ncbi:kinesin-like protein Klp10A [Euwallacea similis]|uniref:kinesin-like protein Klp10A n=1 Tax=Euwallacea similis TaxID=1736056 RepID=UPI00345104C7
MSDKVLAEGDTIHIKRTNGTLQTAVISAIDHELASVKVEWFEDMETKGKEINFNSVISLNPGCSIVKPKFDGNHSSFQRIEEASLRDKDDQRGGGNAWAQSAKTRCTDAQKESNGLRLERRRKQAEVKAVRNEFLRRNLNNPHWQLFKMIQDFRRQMQFKTVINQDHVEEHLITVVVRKRPLNYAEILRKEIDIITVPSNDHVLVHEPKFKVDLTKYLENHTFCFDCALDEHCSNKIVYKYTAQPLIKTVFQGGFATCFAYGQTGSGKTYTMSGSMKHSERGIYELTANDIFKNASSPKYRHHGFIVSCSFFEIYVKKVFDLLNNKTTVKILEDGQQQVQTVGLTEKIVSSVDEVLNLIIRGNDERASGQTSANSQSSRSHAIFQFYLRRQMSPQQVYGKFSLIDLAGNERGANTLSTSKNTRFEGAEINQSLLSLKECIRALGRKGAHLPFRSSKLTQVLRDSFVGSNSKTCMIAMISPGVGSCEHTLNTLRYADRVKELGGGNVSGQKFETNTRDLTSTYGTLTMLSTIQCPKEEIKSKKDETMLKHNYELVKILQKYLSQAEGLLKLHHADAETYYVNLNIVVTDVVASLIKIKNLLNYFVVLKCNLEKFIDKLMYKDKNKDWCIIILEYGSVWQQYAGHGKDFITEDVKIIICSNLISQVNDRTS